MNAKLRGGNLKQRRIENDGEAESTKSGKTIHVSKTTYVRKQEEIIKKKITKMTI